MAYTYDDFLRTASASKMLNRFDKDDLQITRTNPDYGLSLLSLMRDQDNAATPEARLLAGEAINQLRVQIRPGTFTDGVPVDPKPEETPVEQPTAPTVPEEQPAAPTVPEDLPAAPSVPADTPAVQTPQTSAPAADAGEAASFTYDNEDEYQKLLAALTNPDAFRYNHEQDPNWAAYRKAYLREGERATADALARAAAATGGIPSSYAITAAQQAGANYADQLAALIPTLEQNAYSRYLNQQDRNMNALQLLQADRENEYARYLAQLELEGKQETAKDAGTAATGISEGDLVYLKSAYPTGQITDKYFWDMMVNEYGEEALNAAGYFFGEKQGNTWQDPVGVSPGGAFIDRVSGVS